MSWTAWEGVPGQIGGYGLGFNPPAILDYAKGRAPLNMYLVRRDHSFAVDPL